MSSDDEGDNSGAESEDPRDPEHHWFSRRYKQAYELLHSEDIESVFLEHIKTSACFDFEYTFQNPATDKGEKTCLFTEACELEFWSVVAYMLPRVSRVMWFELAAVFGHVSAPYTTEEAGSSDELSEAMWTKFTQPGKGGRAWHECFIDARWRGDQKRHYGRGFKDPVAVLVTHQRTAAALVYRLVRLQPDKAHAVAVMCMDPFGFRADEFQWLTVTFKQLVPETGRVFCMLEKWHKDTHMVAQPGRHPVSLRMLELMCKALAGDKKTHTDDPFVREHLTVLDDLLANMLTLYNERVEYRHLEAHIAVLLAAGASPKGAAVPSALQELVKETTTEQACNACCGTGKIAVAKRKREEE